MNSVPTELPVALYYLDNFLKLLGTVTRQYNDLLTTPELDFIARFQSLSTLQQALLVRLYARKGTLFRSDKVNYEELPGLASLAAALLREGFIQCNPAQPVRDLLSLATCQELRRWWPDKLTPAFPPKRKAEIITALSSMSSGAYYKQVPYTVFSIEHQGFCELLLLLFFGHPDQDLSAFVTTELGYIRYEKYALSRQDRLFRTRRDIEHALQLMYLRTTFHNLEVFTADIGQQLFAQLPAIASDSPLKTRHDRLCNHLGRALESCEANPLALQCYQKSSLPPARERQARILFKQKRYATATELCNAMLRQTRSEAESQFAKQFTRRCLKQLGHPVKPAQRFQPATAILCLEQDSNANNQPLGIELLARQKLAELSGGTCFYVENWLFRAVFGLTFWQCIFSTVPGAFTQPFQSSPHDLYEPAFRSRRKNAVDYALAQINSQDWRAQLRQRWHQKYGISNPFVGWNPQGWSLISLALARIPPTDWQFVLQRMLGDLRENCCGFPDLIHFPELSGYCLLEVKSPNDKVQTNQLRWMQAFAEHNIPYTLLQVQW